MGKIRIVLIVFMLCVPFVVAYLLLYGPLSKGTYELFYDNMNAEAFGGEKTETFEIEGKSIVLFSYDCNISSGRILSTIKDSSGKEIFTNTDNMNFTKEWEMELDSGEYTYYLKGEVAKGTYIFRGIVKEVLEKRK